MQSRCEDCLYFAYDEEYDDYGCTMQLDEDEAARFQQGTRRHCPYWRCGDDYTIVRKQN